jgi:hypothetical protein
MEGRALGNGKTEAVAVGAAKRNDVGDLRVRLKRLVNNHFPIILTYFVRRSQQIHSKKRKRAWHQKSKSRLSSALPQKEKREKREEMGNWPFIVTILGGEIREYPVIS